MTGFAARTGEAAGQAWAWEARSVNGKGLDLRLRLPEGIEGLEAAVRAEAQARFARGNVTVALRLDRATAAGGPAVDALGLGRALDAVAEVEAAAAARGQILRATSAAEVLAMRGVLDTSGASAEDDGAALKAALLADAAALLDALRHMRLAEGRALYEILAAQLARIESLAAEAAAEAEARGPAQAEALRAALARVTDGAEAADPARVAQELALIAVKADVTEEIDRLKAHVAAARALLQEGEPVGRRLDFLAQEFNREANTLASKANHAGLTRVALELKAVIDQMREQVQNVQ
jgi:uncharacterized protein (TIGR00255 family)